MYANEPRLEELGPLNVLRIRGREDAPTFILFHGYGASAYDLYPLHQVIQPNVGLNWIFPDGPLEIPIAPGYMGRAWFPIDIEALQKAMMTGNFRDLTHVTPPGLAEAREKAIAMIDALGIPFRDLILGGFSQGAMLSVDIALRHEKNPRGLVILSGTLLNQEIWKELASRKGSLNFFQSHGRQDPILSYQAARDLNELLREAGMVGEFVSFPGGHEIPYEVIDGLNRYIDRSI